jgi:2'-5' RNA ligase
MRLFIAIEIPTDLQERVSQAAGILEREVPRKSVRWVRPEGRHLTLKFLGEVPSDKVDAIRQGMQRAVAPYAPLQVDLAGFGVFPNIRRPRVLWVGVDNPDGRLADVQSALEDRMAELGFERERRRFHPHITLGRVGRNVRGGEARELADRLDEFEIGALGGIEVRQVHLIRSELQPSGAVYTRMGAAALEGDSDAR